MKTRIRRGLSSWAINRPIGTVMLTATLLVMGLVYVGRIRWTCCLASSIRT
jgi:hypothetical protein